MDNIFDPNKLKIVDFNIIKGEIDALFEFECSLIKEYGTKMRFNISFDIDNEIIKADIGFSIKTKSKKKQKESSANFDFVFVYKVENFDELIKFNKKDDEVDDVNGNLIMSIASISFSTSRGILMTRLQGTAMKDYMLPIINPNKLLFPDIEEEE